MDSLRTTLKNGTHRQRLAATIELAISQSGTPFFNRRAPVFRQQQVLGLVKEFNSSGECVDGFHPLTRKQGVSYA